MRQIIRQHELVVDDWSYPVAAVAAPGAGGAAAVVAPSAESSTAPDPASRLLTLAEFLESAPAAKPGTLGLWLEPADEVEKVGELIDRARVVVAHFPKTGEGRGYTQAQLLRQRFRYKGELRACGVIFRDQLFFLARCGFDSFDLDPAEDLQGALAAYRSFTVAYQPSSDPQGQLPGQRFR